MVTEDEILKRFGISFYQNPDREGSQAWVFYISPDKVLKLTTDKSYYLSMLRAKEFNLDIVPKLFFAEELVTSKYFFGYVIVEERLSDLSIKESNLISEVSDLIEDTGGEDGLLVKKLLRTIKLSDCNKTHKKFIEKKLIPIAQELERAGIIWWDYYEMNFMKRGKELVICDIGCSSLEKKELPASEKLSFGKKKGRIIDRLREWRPDLTWHYNPSTSQWINNEGWTVAAYSMSAPQYDSDDNHYEVHYRRQDTRERLDFLPSILLSE